MKDSHKNKGTRTEFVLQPPDQLILNSDSSETICSIDVKATDQPEAESTSIPDELPSSEPSDTNLYKLKTNKAQPINFTPNKIEFRRTTIKRKACKCLHLSPEERVQKDEKLPETRALVESPPKPANCFLSRLKRSFTNMHHRKLFVDGHNNHSFRSPGKQDPEKIDIYYFDHGNAAYFRTTDCPPTIMSEMLAQQTTYYATRFWAEFFGSLHIGVTFFITFFLQTYRFILCSFVRALIVGVFQMTSDYLFKPILTTIFNDAIQPVLILLYNILSSLKDMLEPVAETIGNFLGPVAMLLKSIRLISFTRKSMVCHKDTVFERHENHEA